MISSVKQVSKICPRAGEEHMNVNMLDLIFVNLQNPKYNCSVINKKVDISHINIIFHVIFHVM